MRPNPNAAVIISMTLLAAPVMAEEQTLEFMFTTRTIEEVAMPAPGNMGHTLSVARSAGTAVFSDGRLADKQYTFYGDNGSDSGTFDGYSIYTFENGDQIHASFTGGWSSKGVGGDYTVVAGTGAYEGVTGTGRFDAADNPWEDTSLWRGSFSLTLPES